MCMVLDEWVQPTCWDGLNRVMYGITYGPSWELYGLKYGANTCVHLKVVPNGENLYTVLIFTDIRFIVRPSHNTVSQAVVTVSVNKVR